MKTISNDIEVFQILEQEGVDSFHPEKETVFEFENEELWFLFLFSPKGPYKGCKLFLLEKTAFAIELEKQLLPAILDLPDTVEFEFVKNQALLITENWISSGNTSFAFYDAH